VNAGELDATIKPLQEKRSTSLKNAARKPRAKK
jgi:hypothetical protein